MEIGTQIKALRLRKGVTQEAIAQAQEVCGHDAEAIAALKANLAFYCRLVDAVKQHWAQHNTLYGFMPDHGCHEIDGGCGAHGLDMEEDMNIVHLYGCNARK